LRSKNDNNSAQSLLLFIHKDMRVIEGRDTIRFDIADYMKNFSRNTSKTNKTLIKNTAEDDY